jgi:hypothetical protein
MRTQLLLKYKPNRSNVVGPLDPVIDGTGGLADPIGADNNYDYRSSENPNYQNNKAFLQNIRPYNGLVSIDLFEDTDIPLNYTILDIREPDKRKTSFSKTIVLPGTKNNNKIFNHSYEIGIDSKFNPNLRTEVVILQDGVQVMRGNMQLKNIKRNNNNDIQYDVLITGDFTSLFADIGVSKISDLDFTEYSHIWNRESIENSWNGVIKKGGADYINVDIGSQRNFNSIERQSSTGRVQITTTTGHGLDVDDWIRIYPVENTTTDLLWPLIKGEFAVSEVINGTTFTINYPFPDALLGNSLSGYITKWTPKGEGYVYPMISWGDDLTPATFPTTSFVMGFYLKDIWDKIFKETGSRYESNFINSPFFKRLIMVQKKKEYDLPPSEFEGRRFKVANETQPEITFSGFGTNNTGSISGQWRSIPYNTNDMRPYPFTASIANSDGLLFNGNEGASPFNQSTNKWVVTDSGRYALSFQVAVDTTMSISDYTAGGVFQPPNDVPQKRYYLGGTPAGAYIEELTVRLELKRKSGGVTSTVDSIVKALWTPYTQTIIKDTFKDWRTGPQTLSVNFASADGEPLFLNKDDELWIEMSYLGNFNNDVNGLFTVYEDNGINESPRYDITGYRGIGKVRVRGVQIFENKPSAVVDENSEVFASQFLPKDMTCKDFLLSMIRAFNLHIDADNEIEKYYKIEPRDDYYRDGSGGVGDYVDWTSKVDLDNMEIIPMGELTAKFYKFEYKTETDYWNRKYKDDVGVGYGDYIKEVQNDFLQNENKISLAFGSSVMINNPADSGIVIPQIVQRESGVNKITNSAPKLLFWGGPKPTTRRTGGIFRWTLKEQQATGIGLVNYSSYPYAGTVDSPFDPEIDLNFFYTQYVYWNRARWTNENLYNKYWRRFIEEITDKDSKLIKAYVRLNPKDIYNLDFRKIYVINGNYLRLQKIIDYNANGDGLTLCEFLKLKSPSRFKRASKLVADDFLSYVDNTRPVVNIIKERAPFNYVDRTPLGNVSPNSTGGNVTTTINGNSNVISDRTTNVSIQGDENFIGGGSTNINITGSGVFVSGGLRNVNIIGTDKIFVDENDVTYINGIRYKNGISISKANVIDGGLNKVLDKNAANTVVNIIDAGEDVIIPFGSSSPENVINAGVDRILPDMPDYGLTTFTNANQETNFAGPVGQSFTEESLSQKIIERVDPRPYEDK